MSKRRESKPTSRRHAAKKAPRAVSRSPKVRRLLKAMGQGSDQTIVVYIHGIGPKPPKDVWKSEWDIALFGRDMEDQTRGAYWADILHDQQPLTAQAIRSAAVDRLDVKQLLREAGVDEDNTHAQLYVQRLADSLLGPVGAVPGDRRMGTQAIPLPELLRKPISEALMRWFVKDTAAYFFDADVRQRIKERLIAEIPSGGEPFVLVSHSQGTIISYEVLSEIVPPARAEVALDVTLGSPLGLQEVEDELKTLGLKQEVPPGVTTWHNFADRLDPVALDKTLADEYDARDSVEISDHLIVNQNIHDLKGINPHDAAGYLANPEVRQVVYRALRFDAAGRFVVARDVAQRFVARGERQPVLIEVLEPHYHAVGESLLDMHDREKKQKKDLHTMTGRIDELAEDIRSIVRKLAVAEDARKAVEAADVQELRKYVAARLTSSEIGELATRPAEFNVYAVWRSAQKRKLLDRSHGPLSADAARASYGADGDDITWAVLDTGCWKDHPHFADHDTVIDVLDCTKKNPKPISIGSGKNPDRDGHGTHVCGIIAGAGQTKDGRSYLGVAPRARLLVYKVLDDQGKGEDAWIIKAIDDIFRRNQNATHLKVHGVNLSLGGPFDATVYGCGFSPICKELRDLWQQGVLVCVAAGNEGQIAVSTTDGTFDLNTLLSVGDPANLENCVAVGSVNTDKPHIYGVSYFSSRGPTADGRMKPDVVAPGERIYSCNSDFKPKQPETKDNPKYRAESGTSMACPHVSGLLASFLSVRTEFIGRPDEVKDILLRNCNDLRRDRYHQGAGIPNLMKMLMDT